MQLALCKPYGTLSIPLAFCKLLEAIAMTTFSRYEAGAPGDWGRGSFFHPRFGRRISGKVFLREVLGLDGMEVSLNRMESGQAVPFLHRHREHEELYLFLSGTGEFQVDGETFPVGPGTAVRVSPEGVRTWRSTGTDPLVFVVVQAASGSIGAGSVDDGERVPGEIRW
jgi:mannose-6-phosphate isomerase-like protein (cupin superfamily)